MKLGKARLAMGSIASLSLCNMEQFR